jgi:hypothetical protein
MHEVSCVADVVLLEQPAVKPLTHRLLDNLR